MKKDIEIDFNHCLALAWGLVSCRVKNETILSDPLDPNNFTKYIKFPWRVATIEELVEK